MGIGSQNGNGLLRARVSRVSNLEKTKMMVNGSITKDGLSKIKVNICGVCSLRVMAKSVLCVWCGEWNYGRCAIVKMVTSMFQGNITSKKCEGNIGEAVEQEERSCYEVETMRKFTYLGVSVRACGGCEAAVSARTRCW